MSVLSRYGSWISSAFRLRRAGERLRRHDNTHLSVRPSVSHTYHTVTIYYITECIYIYILYNTCTLVHIYTRTHRHTHTYCVLVGTCNTAVHKTPSQIILSGITLSPLIVLRGKAHETHQANQALWAGHRFQEGQKRAARLENCWRLDNYIST